MKQQTTALLLSALLLSTFATELHTKLRQAPDPKKTRNLISTRDESTGHCNQNCTWECVNKSDVSPPISNGTITVIIKGDGSFIAFVDAKANVAIVIDFSTGLIAFFNGTSGTAGIFDPRTRKIFIVPGEKCQDSWHASNLTFDLFIGNFSLSKFLKSHEKDALSFTDKSIDAKYLKLFVDILVLFYEEWQDVLVDAEFAVFEVLDELFGRFSNVSSSGVLLLLTRGNTTTVVGPISIAVFLAKCEGIVFLFLYIKVNISLVIQNSKIEIDFQKIIVLDGADCLSYLVNSLEPYFKFSFSDISTVIWITGKLEAGYSHRGLQHFKLLLSEILESAKNQTINENLIRLLIKVSNMPQDIKKSISEQFEIELKKLSVFGFSDLDKFLKKWEVNRVRIDLIIKILLSSESVFYIVVAVIFKLVQTEVKVVLLQLFLILLKFLNSCRDRSLVFLIIEDRSIIKKYEHLANSCSDNFLVQLAKSSSIQITIHNIIDVVGKIPVIEKLCKRLDSLVKHFSKGSITLVKILEFKDGWKFVFYIFVTPSPTLGGGIGATTSTGAGAGSYNPEKSVDSNGNNKLPSIIGSGNEINNINGDKNKNENNSGSNNGNSIETSIESGTNAKNRKLDAHRANDGDGPNNRAYGKNRNQKLHLQRKQHKEI